MYIEYDGINPSLLTAELLVMMAQEIGFTLIITLPEECPWLR